MRTAHAADKPNIVILLADDMGYGDPHCFNAESKCRTPHLDSLAAAGMRFTDAHAAGSTCIPSRYGLVTGRYPFRCENFNPSKAALIENGRATIASVLRDRGYHTAMVGKWHLGFEGGVDFDYSKPLRGGPHDHGFEYFFGQHASLDIPPYFYIENDHAVAAPTNKIEANNSEGWTKIQGAFWRAGGIAPGFVMEEVLPTYTRKAVEYIEQRSRVDDDRPFFLYLAITAPHTPWLPTEKFRGTSAGNLYGDWVAQVDDAFGQVLAALDRAGVADNTLVLFSSDNGPVWYPADVEKYGHSSTGPLRGMKGDVWEGGHRMPFIARWPGHIKPGSTSGKLICFTDVLATFADLTGATLPDNGGEDSFTFLPELLGQSAGDKPQRQDLLLGHGSNGLFLRRGDWKLIPFLGSGGFTRPSRIKPKPGEPGGQLYNLAKDLGETTNTYAEHADIVKELTTRTTAIVNGTRTRP
ncbi:MAG: sulfatase-like hydrolase/transferase [Phycisphaera sp.]|nr:sulfatase-like hydrolase/transferase [Phycisphaera sp.]